VNYIEALATIVGEVHAAEIAAEYPAAPDLARADVESLRLTPAKRRALGAALALGQLAQGPRTERPVIRSNLDVFAVVGGMRHALTESMRVLCLDVRHRVVRDVVVAHGGRCGVGVSPCAVFAPAIAHGAGAVILAHNHPSGDATPSRGDFEMTRQIIAAGRILGIKVLDHVVVGCPSVSMQDAMPHLFAGAVQKREG
jgi:DNA repair protein RadC